MEEGAPSLDSRSSPFVCSSLGTGEQQCSPATWPEAAGLPAPPLLYWSHREWAILKRRARRSDPTEGGANSLSHGLLVTLLPGGRGRTIPDRLGVPAPRDD